MCGSGYGIKSGNGSKPQVKENFDLDTDLKKNIPGAPTWNWKKKKYSRNTGYSVVMTSVAEPVRFWPASGISFTGSGSSCFKKYLGFEIKNIKKIKYNIPVTLRGTYFLIRQNLIIFKYWYLFFN